MRSYFISSTFSDMNFERDWFQKNVLPRFREAAHSHGEESDAIDLRIGIDTRELETPERFKQVLGVCSKLISKCKPLMIVFIGDRYGSTADEKVITPEFARELNKELNTSVLNRSITALEIDFGIFQKRSSKCIICMRKLRGEFSAEAHKRFFEEDTVKAKKLTELKERLLNDDDLKGKIIEYTANWDGKKLENFLTIDGRNLAEVLLERMKADCQEGADSWLEYEKLSWQEQEEKAAWQFAKVRAENFYARQDTVAHFEELFEDSDIIFLKGAKGTGKTSLLSKIAVDFQNLKRKVCCIFSGTSTRSSNSLDILRQMVFYAEEVAGKDHFEGNTKKTYVAYKQRFAEVCKQIEEQLFFIIDAVDQIDIDSHREHLDFLIKADNVHCLVSGADFDFSKAQRVLGGRVEPLEFLRDDEVEEVLRGILKRNGRDLFPEIAAVVNKSNGKNSPLFLEFVAQIFFLLTAREFNNLNYNEVIRVAVRHVESMSLKKISDAAVYILKEAANLIFEKPQAALATVNLLAISPHGLRRSDLEAILNLNTLDYARLIWYLHTFFFERKSGAIDFNHSLIRDGILNYLDQKYIDDGERKITAHIKTLSAQDWLRCLDGATFAQKTLDYEFLATLYGEAFTTENSLLIYGIEQALCSDRGTTCIDLLKNHFNELSPKLGAGCYGFLTKNFQQMLRGSGTDYEISRNILAALPPLSEDVLIELLKLRIKNFLEVEELFNDPDTLDYALRLNDFAQELLVAKQEMFLGEFSKVSSRCKKIVSWGIKHLQLADHIEFCRLMSVAYSQLGTIYFAQSFYEEAKETSRWFLHWAKCGMKIAEGIELAVEDKIQDMFSLANAYGQFVSFNIDNLSPEKILEYQSRAYEIYSELVEIAPFPEIFQAATLNILQLAQTNMLLELNDNVETLLEECVAQTRMLLALHPNDLETLTFVGGIYHGMSLLEIDLNAIERAEAHAAESIRLYRNYIEANPIMTAYGRESLLNVLESLAEAYIRIGDKERANYYKKMANETRRMAKL